MLASLRLSATRCSFVSLRLSATRCSFVSILPVAHPWRDVRFGTWRRHKHYGRPVEGVLGLSLQYGAQGEVLVAGLVQDASASKSGLISVGDQIVEVDGARVQGYSPVMLVNLLCGPKGTSVKLGLRRAGGAPHESGDFGASVEELVLERDSIPSKLLLECCGEIGEDIARPRAYKAAASRERERSLLSTRLKLREDPFLVGGYACAGCEETFVKWRDCLRHMRSEHHVRHDLFPYVRNAKTKEIWVDRPMDKRLRLLLRIYPSSSRCEPGTSPSNQIDADIHADGGESSQHGDKGAVELNSDLEERRAQAAPVDPFVIVERLGVGDIPQKTRQMGPPDQGNPLPPHRAQYWHIYRQLPVVPFKKLLAKKEALEAKARRNEVADLEGLSNSS